MLSILLLKYIAQLFLIVAVGWIIVKAGVLKSEDSRPLSMLLLYVISPCVTINAFQRPWTQEIGQMLLLSFAAGLLLNILPLLLMIPFGRIFRLSPVEKATVIFPNSGNLTIPLVAALFGQEWIVFVNIFTAIQIMFVWTHGKRLISGEKEISVGKLLKNPNIIAAGVGLLLFLTQIRLPAIVLGALDQVSAMIGPAAMIIVGMLMAEVDLRGLKKYARIWRVVLLRLVVFSGIATLLAKFCGLAALAPNGELLLLISLLSTITPSASTITQLSQIYDNEPEYAGLINVVTLLLCIVTMPLMVMLYQM